MLDAPARRAQRSGVVGEGIAISIQHQAIAAIADGVGRDLHAARPGAAKDRAQILERRHQQPVARRILVGREQRRPARAQRAVHIELDAAHLHQPARIAVRATFKQVVGILRGHVEIGMQWQFALPSEFGEQGRLFRAGAHIGHTGPAARRIKPRRLRQGFAPHRRRQRGQPAFDKLDRVVDQHAGGRAGSIAFDASAFRIWRASVDPGERQRRRIRHHRVAVDPIEQHRPAAHHRVQIGAARKPPLRPMGFDPAAPAYRPGGMGAGIFAQALLQGRDRGRPHQVEQHRRHADAR